MMYSFAKKYNFRNNWYRVGNANRINVNIMMPGDEGSNQPLHNDIHSGESSFQCVLWIPLTDAYETKGIFILPPEPNKIANLNFKEWMEKEVGSV